MALPTDFSVFYAEEQFLSGQRFAFDDQPWFDLMLNQLLAFQRQYFWFVNEYFVFEPGVLCQLSAQIRIVFADPTEQFICTFGCPPAGLSEGLNRSQHTEFLFAELIVDLFCSLLDA